MKYVYVGDSLAQEVDANGTTTAFYSPGISQSNGTSTTFFQPDHLGSTVATASDTFPAGYQGYDAWGNTLYQTGQTTPFGFVGAKGYYTDEGSGLMKLGVRYYDPTIGRFITKDPARDGTNWYAYCGNDPPNAVDPTGLKPVKIASNSTMLHQVNGAVDLIDVYDHSVATGIRTLISDGRLFFNEDQANYGFTGLTRGGKRMILGGTYYSYITRCGGNEKAYAFGVSKYNQGRPGLHTSA